MAARLQGTFYSEDGVRIGVTIDDDTYTGTAIDFDCLNLAIEWRGDDSKERFSPIIGSEAKISLLVNNSDLEDFIEDLVNAVEGRFTVTVGTSDGFDVQSRWCGYITTDLATIEDVPLEIGYAANLSAVDGLGVLKGIKYSDSDSYPYTGYATFIDHILNCINELGFVGTYYGTTSPILRTVCNWHANEYTYSTSIDPLLRSKISHAAFYWIDNKGNYRFRTCYEVLEYIATAWGARIMFSGTSFWFVQVNQYTNPASNTVFAYTSDGTQSTESADGLRLIHDQANITSSDLLRYSGGVFSFFAPLKYVEANYQHLQSRNILAGVTIVNGDPATFETLEVFNFASSAFLSYSANVRMNASWVSGTFITWYAIFRMQVQCGGYYYVGGDGYSEPAWTLSPGYYYIVAPIVSTENYNSVFSISFVTPELGNIVQDSLTFSISIYKAYDLANNELDIDPATGQILISYEIFNQYLEAVGDGNFDDQSDILRYSSTNNAYATKEYKVTIPIGDGPNSITPGHIEVMDDASDWVLSTGWRVGNSGEYNPFPQQLVNEIIRGQLSSVRRLQTSFSNLNAPYLPLQPHNAIYYGLGNWVSQSMTWDLKTNIASGEWFKLQSATTYTENAVEYVPEGSDSGASTSVGGGSTGSSGGGGTSTGGGSTQPAIQSVILYSEEFLSMITNALTVIQNAGILPTNEAQIKVYQNGQKLLQSQWSASGSTITIDTNTHYDGANYEVEFIIIQ